MSKFADKAFWVDAADRAASTSAQTLAAGLTVTGLTGILDVAWGTVLSAAALAGIVSLVQSVATRQPKDA